MNPSPCFATASLAGVSIHSWPKQTLAHLRWLAVLTTVLVAVVTFAPAAEAQNAGSLDTSFNSPKGFVTVGLGNTTADATAIDSQGRIVAVGKVNSNWEVVRYKKDGTPDNSFGTNGVVTTSIVGTGTPLAVAIDNSDNIVAAGATPNSMSGADFAVARFNANDGSLDLTGFGKAGLATVDFGNSAADSNARGVAIDSSGKIVVAGTSTANGSSDFALAKFDNMGNLDPTFGGGAGWVLTDFGTGSVDQASAVAIGPVSGRIVLAGFSNVNGNNDFALARYMSSGTLDTSFVEATSPKPGTVVTDITNAGSQDEAFAVAVTEDQSGSMTVVAAGSSNAHFALARYLDDGSLDPAFNSSDHSGKVITDFSNAIANIKPGTSSSDFALAVAIDHHGRIVAAGTTEYVTSTSSVQDIALARYDAQGNLDTNFGSGGRVDQGFGGAVGGISQGANVGLAIDGDGNLVTAGALVVTGNALIARFLGQAVRADLQLTMTGFPTSVNPGDTITYTISVTNAGPNPASSVSVADTLPSAVAFSSCSSSTGDACSFSVGTVTVNFTSGLSVSTTPVTITMLAMVNSGVVGGSTITNTAMVTAMTTDPNPNNNTASASVTVASADLQIANQVSPSAVGPGATVTYTLFVANNGPSNAGNVIVTDMLPSQVTFVSCSSPGGACSGSGNNQTINFAFPPFNGVNVFIGTLTATLNAGVADGTLVQDTASVASASGIPDPNPNNNSALASFVVLNKADLSVSLSVSKISNRQITYTVSVKNSGPFAAAQILLNDAIPAGTNFVSIAPGAWSCSAPPVGGTGKVSCTLAGLAPNVTSNITFAVKVTVPGSVSISDTATVSAATFDPNAANNSATLVSKLSAK